MEVTHYHLPSSVTHEELHKFCQMLARECVPALNPAENMRVLAIAQRLVEIRKSAPAEYAPLLDAYASALHFVGIVAVETQGCIIDGLVKLMTTDDDGEDGD